MLQTQITGMWLSVKLGIGLILTIISQANAVCVGVQEQAVTFADEDIQQIDVDLKQEILGLILLTSYVRELEFEILPNGLIKTDINTHVCQEAGRGFKLEQIEKISAFDPKLMYLIEPTLLTGNRLVHVEASSTNIIVDEDGAKQIWDSLNWEDGINYSESVPYLVYTNGGIKNLPHDGKIVCQGDAPLRNLYVVMENVVYNIKHLYERINNLNELFTETTLDMENLEACFEANLSIHKFENLFKISKSLLLSCVNLQRTKRSNLVSWLVGDGEQVDTIQNSLATSVKTFNRNFKKIQESEASLQKNLKVISTEVGKIELNSQATKQRAIIDQIKSHKREASLQFVQNQNMKLNAIRHAILDSTVDQDLNNILRSLMGLSNILDDCTVSACVTSSYVKLNNGIVELHQIRKSLKAAQKYVITCAPISAMMIPKYHGLHAVWKEDTLLFTETSPVTWEQLNDDKFLENNTRFVTGKDKHLGNLIITQSEEKMKIICLENTLIVLNSKTFHCISMQQIQIDEPREFSLVTANGAIRTSHVRDKFEIPSLDLNMGNDNQDTYIQIDDEFDLLKLRSAAHILFLDEAGEISVAKVAINIGSISLIVLILMALLVLCCKCGACTNCNLGKCMGCCQKSSARNDVRKLLARLGELYGSARDQSRAAV